MGCFVCAVYYMQQTAVGCLACAVYYMQQTAVGCLVRAVYYMQQTCGLFPESHAMGSVKSSPLPSCVVRVMMLGSLVLAPMPRQACREQGNTLCSTPRVNTGSPYIHIHLHNLYKRNSLVYTNIHLNMHNNSHTLPQGIN